MCKSIVFIAACVSALFFADCSKIKITPYNDDYFVISISPVSNSAFEMAKVFKSRNDKDGLIVLAAKSDSLKQGDKVGLIKVSRRGDWDDNIICILLAVKQ